MKIVIPRIIKSKVQLTWDWSGTVTNLKKALAKYEEVEEQNIFYNFRMRINKYLIKLHLRKDDFGLLNIKEAEKQLSLVSNDVCLTFDEFPKKTKYANKIFIYQDLSAFYLLELAKRNYKYYEYSGFQKISTEILEKRSKSQSLFYDSADGIFTMSKWLADYLVNQQKIPSQKVHYVGAGVNISPNLVEYNQRNRRRFLFVGKDFQRKSGDLVHKAFEYLQTNLMKEAELYIIGPEKCPIENDNPNIYFLGDIPSSEVVKYYNLCDVFVMPSRFEAFGIVFIEALGYGLPCIGRDLMEMPNLIKDGINGKLIDEYDEDYVNLAHEMYDLIRDDQIFMNVRELREELISEFSWDNVAKKIIEVMRKS